MLTLWVRPTLETVERLQSIMSHAPCRLEPFSELAIPILETEDHQTPSYAPSDTQSLYAFEFTAFKPFFVEHSGYSKLVGFGRSPSLTARRQSLTGMRSDWIPHITVSHAFELARTSKHWVASISDTLVAKERPFTFQGEFWAEAKEPYTPPIYTNENANILV